MFRACSLPPSFPQVQATMTPDVLCNLCGLKPQCSSHICAAHSILHKETDIDLTSCKRQDGSYGGHRKGGRPASSRGSGWCREGRCCAPAWRNAAKQTSHTPWQMHIDDARTTFRMMQGTWPTQRRGTGTTQLEIENPSTTTVTTPTFTAL
jgi:hypothetical protein